MKSSGNICTFSWVKQQFLMWRQSWNNPQETVHCHCQISSHTGTFWGGTNWTNIGILSGTDCPILTQSTLPFPPSAHLCVWARCGWPFFFVPINTSYTCSTLMRVLMGVVVSLCECMYSAVHVCVWLRVIMRVINVQLVVRVCVCVRSWLVDVIRERCRATCGWSSLCFSIIQSVSLSVFLSVLAGPCANPNHSTVLESRLY